MQDTYIIQIEEPILEIGGDGAIAREILTKTVEVVFVTQPPTVYEILDVSTDALILEVNRQGPAGAPGSSSVGLFILDVLPLSGIIGGKTFKPGIVPATANVASAVSDNANVRIVVGANGGANTYSPTMTVNGVMVTLDESSTKRWFVGYADIVLHAGANTITALSSDGGTDTATITLAGAGPAVTAVTFSAYPGTQTELKAQDQIGVAVTTEPSATTVTLTGGLLPVTLPVVDGRAAGTVTIDSSNGQHRLIARAKNDLGTIGAPFSSPALNQNQTYPSFTVPSVSYPTGQLALNVGESGAVACTVSNADVVLYSATGLTVAPGYAVSKAVKNTSTGYVGTGVNYAIAATRTANDATASTVALVRIATVAAAAAISVAGNPARLASSPSGVDYEIRITPTQTLLAPPSLNTSKGAWQGVWIQNGAYWSRMLRITDADARGVGTFTGLLLYGLSGLTGNSITAGDTFVVGGFSSRTLTFPAFSRVTALGTTVDDVTKVVAQLAGGAMLTRYNDNGTRAAGFYIAAADGSYNPVGAYIGLSDAAFAGANTSGTLQIVVQENA